ncbi:hypothetical protein ACLKMY_35675 [Paraburkholderia mimosarum]|uniref:hypothetical protein n=1 Tax=Paraburkholderia mimosarum TaxID=312026 RepID=UPI0039C1C9E0
MNSTQSNTQSFEEKLMNLLQFSGLDEDNLSELITIVSGLHDGGLRNIYVNPRGTPVIDGLTVNAVLEAKSLGVVLGDLVTKTPRLGGVSVFPYGIIAVEQVGVTIELGATVQQ